MSKQLTFLALAKKVLTEAKRPLAPSEIWKIAISKGYQSQLSSEGKIPAQTLYSALFTDQRDNPDTIFIRYNTRPARYYLKGLADSTKSADLEETAASEPSVPQIASYKEAQLHAFVSYFVSQRFNARSKTGNYILDVEAHGV